MPQVNVKQAEGSTRPIANDKKSVRERLHEMFKSHEFIRVKNIDDEDFEWQYMPTMAEEETIEDGGATHAIWGRQGFTKNYEAIVPGNEQIWMIEAGATEVLLGENAYLFIDGLYKRVVAKRMIEKTPNATSARNFNWSDGTMQQKIIDEILVRVETPQFNEPASASKKTAQ